jgi:hypothetical protein
LSPAGAPDAAASAGDFSIRAESRAGVGGVATTAPESEIDGQWGWVAAIHTSRWRVQRIPAEGREVPSPQTRNVIEASPFDPAANLAGALRAPSDRRSLGVVSWPEISKQFQKFALILRRTFPRPVPRGVYDHSPTPRSPRQRIAQNRPEIRRAPPIGIGTRTPPAAEGPPAASHWAVVPARRETFS